MDIMFLGSQKTPILHIVDEGTRFSVAVLMSKGASNQQIWEAFLKSWATVYTGLPNRILVDEGTNFGDSFLHLARAANESSNRQASRLIPALVGVSAIMLFFETPGENSRRRTRKLTMTLHCSYPSRQ